MKIWKNLTQNRVYFRAVENTAELIYYNTIKNSYLIREYNILL